MSSPGVVLTYALPGPHANRDLKSRLWERKSFRRGREYFHEARGCRMVRRSPAAFLFIATFDYTAQRRNGQNLL